MPFRVTCPRCRARLEAPQQVSIRCPECGAVFAVEQARGASRRPPARAGASRGLLIVLAIGAAAGMLLLIAAVIVAIVVLRGHGKPGIQSARSASTSPASTATTSSVGRKKWVPGVSEKELQALMDRKRIEGGEAAVQQMTEEEVYAIMGEPTRRDTPITVQRNGQTLTLYEARWEHREPAREYSTVISFVNGCFAGGIIGLEVTPRASGASPAAPAASQPTPPATDRQPTLSRTPADLLVGEWEADIPPGVPSRPGQPKKVRVTFGADGSVTVKPEPAAAALDWRGTWKAERTEPPRLWAHLNLRRAGTNDVPSIGNPILFNFHNDDEFDSAGFVSVERLTFRRVRKP